MDEDPDALARAKHPTLRPASSASTTSHTSRSSLSSSSSIISTRTLQPDDITFVAENGRIYPNEHYYMPCDAQEQDRLAVVHRVYLGALAGALSTVPLSPKTARILDVGTGPGDWAVAIAQKLPWAEVVAVDIAVWDVDATEAAAKRGDAGENTETEDEEADDTDGFPNLTWQIDDLDVWPPGDEVAVIGLEQAWHPSERRADDAGYQWQGSKYSMNADVVFSEVPYSPHASHNAADRTIPVGDRAPGEESPNRQSHPHHWSFTEPFDFIHIRGMKGAFHSWPTVYTECFQNLNPGGWLEVVDYQITGPELGMHSAPDEPSDDPSDDPDRINQELDANKQKTSPKRPDTTVQTLFESLRSAAERSGYPFDVSHLSPGAFADAGFLDIRTTTVDIPLLVTSSPSPDPHTAALSKLWLVAVIECLEAASLRLLTREGWSAERVRELCTAAAEELLAGEGNHGIKGVFKFVAARKPNTRTEEDESLCTSEDEA